VTDSLERLTAICAALPEAVREVTGRHAGFKVRGRTFAYYLDDHHGDGMVALNAKLPPGESEALVETAPERYHRPAYLGARGWVGLRLDTPEVDWDEVADLVHTSYGLVAPKRLSSGI
jgi:predicted DNA-binding protein (MmcQ/YjbR family)